MERKKVAPTPEDYTRAIISLSRRYSSTSVFPGNNFVGIAEWMLQSRILLQSTSPKEDAALYASKSNDHHDLVIVYNSGEKKWDVQQYSQREFEAFSAVTSASAGSTAQVVFIRGFISPAWVSAIGSKYGIDPEFFRRHMDFLSASIERHAYSTPSLPSSSTNLFRLCVNTLLHRDVFGGQDLQLQRSNQATELAAYKIQQLGSTRVSCGDSLVREYSTVCSIFSVVEQWISLCITRTESGWAVIAWMDQGRPLEKSPPEPWTSHIESRATALPVLQHHPKMAFRTTTNRLDPEANVSAQIQQSTSILPLQYCSLIALIDLGHRATQDPLCMCLPLFAHAAFSEVQFLNLVESRIHIQINTIVEGDSTDALETLQYFSNILNRHAQQLRDSNLALSKLAEKSDQTFSKGKAKSPPPASLKVGMQQQTPDTDTSGSVRYNTSDGTFTANGVLGDYEQLRIRCIDLSNLCAQGITLAMNKVIIEESRKGIEQSGRVKKLTILATLFIPLSFCSSLFGMNIDLLQQNAVRFWWFFVLCAPVTLFAYVFYLGDYQFLKRYWMGFWRAIHQQED
ncbi:hypothetical protein ACQKWADRAFT_93152 [Trichoderma austrokoningii]